MKKHWSLLIVLSILTAIAVRSHAGTIFYQAIPANQSDAGSGIGTDNQYTSAVDGGNTRGTDRVINGITLYSLNASGQSSTADNCTINGLAGTLSNAGGNSGSVQADGAFRDVLSDMTFNNGASDGSQQEIVLDPDSLEQGATYDLRIYVCNSSGQNRMVDLSFVGDGQAPVETGFFNEDDATTSAGGFKDKNQAYYIDYRFTWDGDSTPGITVTQKTGSAPFVLYALTNQVVPGGGAQTAQQGGGGQAAQQGGGDQGGGDQGGGDQGGGENLSTGQVSADSDDQVGVSSDDFYGSDSLNSNGRWCNLQKYGKCWQPTNVPQGWCPYTNGTFVNCDECGATFVSDEPWAWACYHYGRWCKVSVGCGWCWCPGTVWAGSWVSWRKGTSSNCSCVGWAPLPPDVGCGIDVGINSSVDYTCGLGPECYTFVNVWDFGRESYFGCGCVLERSSYVNIITETTCITNICYGSYGTYCGGPDFHWCNEQIRMHGGRECENVHINRYDDPGKMGGKFMHKEGNSLGMFSPHVKNEKNPKHDPKTAENIKSNQTDKGWKGMKNSNAEKNAKNHIAQDGKGKLHQKATLPKDVQDKVAKNQGQGGGKGMGGNGQGGGGNHPGGHHGKNQGNGGNNTANNQGGNGQGGNNQGGVNKVIRNQDQTGGGTGGNNQGGGKGGKNAGTGTGFDQHPGGKNKNKGGGGNNAMNQGGGQGGNNQGGGGGGKHPGQRKSQGGMNAGNNQGGGGQGGNNQGGGGKGGKNKNQGGGKNNNAANDQGVGNNQGGGGGKGGKNKNQGNGQIGSAWNNGQESGGGTGGGKGGKNKNQGGGTNNTTDASTTTRKASIKSHPTGATGATDTGGQAGNNQGGTGGGGSSGGKHHNKGTGGGGTATGTTNQGTGGSTGQSGGHHNKGTGGGGNAGNTNQGGGGQTSGGGGNKQHHNQGTTGTAGQTGGSGQGGSGQHHMNQGQSGGGQQQHHGGGGGGGQGGGQGGGGGGGGKGAKPKPTPKNAAMSDRRVKTNISFMGWSPKGIPIYQFSYINQPNKRYQGTIAQAIARSRPDAIVWRNGIMWVDYSRLDIQMEEVPSASMEEDGR